MAKLVSKVYGDALFSLALEENKLDEIWEEVKALRTIITENEELSRVMAHPSLTEEEKEKLILTLFEGKVSQTTMGFLDILVKKGRFQDIFDILTYFDEQAKEYKNIGVAYVSTAVAIDHEKKTKIENRLLEISKYQSFEMHFQVKPELIGGMVIRIGDRVVDDSIRNKLDVMAASLSKVQL